MGDIERAVTVETPRGPVVADAASVDVVLGLVADRGEVAALRDQLRGAMEALREIDKDAERAAEKGYRLNEHWVRLRVKRGLDAGGQ